MARYGHRKSEPQAYFDYPGCLINRSTWNLCSNNKLVAVRYLPVGRISDNPVPYTMASMFIGAICFGSNPLGQATLAIHALGLTMVTDTMNMTSNKTSHRVPLLHNMPFQNDLSVKIPRLPLET
jgi:hypothetical protein